MKVRGCTHIMRLEGEWTTNLGLKRWRAVNITPNKTQSPPTITYAIPKKGFFPPITVLVDRTMDFVPPYSVTGKSILSLSEDIHKRYSNKTNSEAKSP